MVYKIFYHEDQQENIDNMLENDTCLSTQLVKNGTSCTMYVHNFHKDTSIEFLEAEFDDQFKDLEKYCIEFVGKQCKLLRWDGAQYKYVKFITRSELLTLKARASEKEIRLVFVGDVI